MYSPDNEANLNSLEKIRQPSNSTPLHDNQTLDKKIHMSHVIDT